MVVRKKHLLILGWIPAIGISLFGLWWLWIIAPLFIEIVGIIGLVTLFLAYICYIICITEDTVKRGEANDELVTLFEKKGKKRNEVSS